VGALALPRFLHRRKTAGQQWLAALGGVVFLFCLTANVGVVTRTSLGFVVKPGTPLLLTPTGTGETIATLTAGEPVRKIRTRGEYWFVRTANAQGWLKRSDAGFVEVD
jgi:hypothetical protein